MKIFTLILGLGMFLCLMSCEDGILSTESVMTRAIVDESTMSISNPTLINNWENVDEIILNTPGSNGVDNSATTPWKIGAKTLLSSEFCKDIKKEDGWRMLFHTFKKIGLDEGQNYMCFYNNFTGYIKVFYYYEGHEKSQNTTWLVKTGNGEKTHLFSLVDYISEVNMADAAYDKILCSNLVKVPTTGITPGWNGFEFEVPYCTDYRDIDFVIAAYDKNITEYNFIGKEKFESVGTITTTNKTSSGLMNALASLTGNAAKTFVDSIASKAILGSGLVKLVSSIPSSGYGSAISAGLGLLFGKTTVTTSDIKLTTSGDITLEGIGTSQTTSDIAPVTFNLYQILNPSRIKQRNANATSLVYNTESIDTDEHFLGVWGVESYPIIGYERFSRVNVIKKIDEPGIEYIVGRVLTPKVVYRSGVYTKMNPDLNPYLQKTTRTIQYSRCDTLQGAPYKPGVKDIGNYNVFFHQDSPILYKDDYNCFHDAENVREMEVDGSVLKTTLNHNISQYYYDWGIILDGRIVATITKSNTFLNAGKTIQTVQSRNYDVDYTFDALYVEDYYPWFNNHIQCAVINDHKPAFGIFIEEKDLPLYGK